MKKNTTYNLFLDDVRRPISAYTYTKNDIYLIDWHVVINYNQFVAKILNSGVPEIISFDHDLAEDKSGTDCARWLINYCINNDKKLPKQIYIHSMNTEGRADIKSLFTTYYKYMK